MTTKMQEVEDQVLRERRAENTANAQPLNLLDSLVRNDAVGIKKLSASFFSVSIAVFSCERNGDLRQKQT